MTSVKVNITYTHQKWRIFAQNARIYCMAQTTVVTNLKIADVFTVIGTGVQVNI